VPHYHVQYDRKEKLYPLNKTKERKIFGGLIFILRSEKLIFSEHTKFIAERFSNLFLFFLLEVAFLSDRTVHDSVAQIEIVWFNSDKFDLTRPMSFLFRKNKFCTIALKSRFFSLKFHLFMKVIN
jgi:hypothetical protein